MKNWFNKVKLLQVFYQLNLKFQLYLLIILLKIVIKFYVLPVIMKIKNGRLIFKSYSKGDNLVELVNLILKNLIKNKVLFTRYNFYSLFSI